MALTYKQAPTVNQGDEITSTQFNQLVSAYNDRLLGGVGDTTFRLHYYWYSFFRSLRNSNGFNVAPYDEWWKIYCLIEPGDALFPEAAPGQPEGAYLGNPINAFVFGNGNDVYGEGDRLSRDGATGEGILLHNTAGAPATDSEKWDVGRYQRGVVDGANTNDLSLANALVAARSHFDWGFYKVYHRSYGGFFPAPLYNGPCSSAPELPDYSLKFTNTSTTPDTVCTYSTCPGGSGSGSCPGTNKPVLSWWKSGTDYILLHNDATITRLPINDYIEGKYDGATNNAFLSHPNGEQTQRALNYFIEQFRGSYNDQEQSDYSVNDYAFQFEDVVERQYYLAPAYGQNDGNGTIEATYERFGFDPSTSANTYGGLHDSSGNVTGTTSYAINTGFVLAGVLAFRDAGSGDKTFSIEVSGTELAQVTIPNGDDSKSVWFAAPAGGTVRVKNITAMGAGDECYVEIAELLEYKPENEDLYLLIRCAAASNTAHDSTGDIVDGPKDISDAYLRHGMIYNGNRSDIAQDNNYLNANPVYRTVNKMVRDNLRMVDRTGLVGYEVSGGKSVLYFNRRAFGLSYTDRFQGIGPSTEPVISGAIADGVQYTVSGGTSITYNGATVAAGAQFTGVHGVTTFTKTAGTENVLEYEGIRSTAGKEGWSNQWVVHLSTVGYKDASGSPYKSDSYSDIMGHSLDRCTVFSDDWTDPTNASGKELQNHVDHSKSEFLQAPESPSGYRYALNTNTPPLGRNASGNLVEQANGTDCDPENETGDCTGLVAHYRSCKVYVPPYLVESVRDAGNNQVRVQLSTRLSYNEDAPNTIADNATSRAAYITADSTGSTNGGYRTDENAVVEYLRRFVDGGANCGQRIGDFSGDANSTSGWDASVISGACMPRFYFTRLIQKAYEDGNNTYEATDSPMLSTQLVWMETVLRAICEGFIDEDSSNNLRTVTNSSGFKSCQDKRLYDYTFENLMTQANGRQHYRGLPTSVRTDGVRGYGPLPSMKAYTDHFNQLSKAINKLTRARIYLPLNFEFKNVQYQSTVSLGVSSNSSPPNCSSGAVWADDVPFSAAWSFVSEDANWRDTLGTQDILAEIKCRIGYDSQASTNSGCVLQCSRTAVKYRFRVKDYALESLPDDLKTLIQANDYEALGFSVFNGISTTTHVKTVANQGAGRGSSGSGASNGSESDYFHSSNYWTWEPDSTPDGADYDGHCVLTTGGTLEAVNPPTSDYVDTADANTGEFAEGYRYLLLESLQGFVQVPLS